MKFMIKDFNEYDAWARAEGVARITSPMTVIDSFLPSGADGQIVAVHYNHALMALVPKELLKPVDPLNYFDDLEEVPLDMHRFASEPSYLTIVKPSDGRFPMFNGPRRLFMNLSYAILEVASARFMPDKFPKMDVHYEDCLIEIQPSTRNYCGVFCIRKDGYERYISGTWGAVFVSELLSTTNDIEHMEEVYQTFLHALSSLLYAMADQKRFWDRKEGAKKEL